MVYWTFALKRARRTGLSARRARRTKSRGPKGLQLEAGARRAPRLLVLNICLKEENIFKSFNGVVRSILMKTHLRITFFDWVWVYVASCLASITLLGHSQTQTIPRSCSIFLKKNQSLLLAFELIFFWWCIECSTHFTVINKSGGFWKAATNSWASFLLTKYWTPENEDRSL